ncbi:MAG: hypothetical protein LBQ43_03980 [Holosporales bacterium]|nr:hypothetical protein [Holosporales bacterium]
MFKFFLVAIGVFSGIYGGLSAIEEDGLPSVMVQNIPGNKVVALGIRVINFGGGHRMIGSTEGLSIDPGLFDKADKVLQNMSVVASGLSTPEDPFDCTIVKLDKVVEAAIIMFGNFLRRKPYMEQSEYSRDIYSRWLSFRNVQYRSYFYEHSNEIGYCDSLNYNDEALYEVVSDCVSSRLDLFPEGGILENGIDLMYCNVKKYKWAVNTLNDLKQIFIDRAGSKAGDGVVPANTDM